MKSDLHKVLHPIAGRPMLDHLLDSFAALRPERTVVVAGDRFEQLEGALAGRGIEIARQEPQLGTAHAALMAKPLLATFDGHVLVCFGDCPMLKAATIKRMIDVLEAGAGVAVLGFRPDDTLAYGRIIADPDGTVRKMVEHKDASDDERAVNLCNSGVIVAHSRDIWRLLEAVGNDNAAGEYYLPDVATNAIGEGAKVIVVETGPGEVAGINSRGELAAADGFDQRDAGATYVPPVGPGLWVTTHPNFGAAIEPNWHRVRPFALQVTRDANGRAVCPAAPTPPIPYDPTPGSAFHREAMVVVDAQANLTDAQRMTAMYWRDNPDGVTGLPAGHWMGIASADTEDSGKDLGEAAEVLALTAICIADAFTSCCIEKYRTNLLRPISYIRDHINPGWTTFVNTPAFPEYTSGHSVGSAAAAHALTTLLGNRSFVDRHSEGRRVTGNPSGTTYTLTARRFTSFTAAADEAASSRLWGGIHYPMGISHGLTQGRRVAELVMATARTTPGNGPR